MNKFEGNPFFWGFNEQRSIETIAKQMKATYNEPREGVEQKTALENYFGQEFGHSSNPAFITGGTALDPLPYRVPTPSNTSEDENEEKEETSTKDEEKTEVDVDKEENEEKEETSTENEENNQ